MQLTKHTDLALRVLMYLAVNPDKLVKIKEIAEAYKVSQNHLVKVVHKLVLIGYICSTRGRGGGITLAKKAEDISIGTVVREMENNIEIINCSKENCPLMSNCLLKRALNIAIIGFFDSLNQHTVHDLVQNLTSAPSIKANKVSPLTFLPNIDKEITL